MKINRIGIGLGLLASLIAPMAWAQPAGEPRDLPLVGIPTPGGINYQPAVTEVAHDVHWLSGMVHGIMAVIVIFVVVLLGIIIFKFNARTNPTPARWTHNTKIEIAWTLIPVVILIFIGSFSLPILFKQLEVPPTDLTIKATGNQWYWSYNYPANDVNFDALMLEPGELSDHGYPPETNLLATDTAVVVPVGKVVHMLVTGADVIHSWAMPSFGVKIDAVPGRLNETWFRVEREGVYFGQCSELCGRNHSYMPITVKAVSQEAYDAWLNWAIDEYGGTRPEVTPAAAEAPASGAAAAAEPPAPPAGAEPRRPRHRPPAPNPRRLRPRRLPSPRLRQPRPTEAGMTDASWSQPVTAYEPEFGDYVELLKPRVMRLVVFTAIVGLVAAPVSVNPVIAFASIVCIAVGAGAAGALNMWWDQDIDAQMARTARRPVPSGRVEGGEALAIGITLSGFSVVFLALFANLFAAGLLAFTIFFYAVVYSMWLKRATPQNIVIGGAAGAFPPMIGWAVATGGVSFESVAMFALIFLWTPPHFWALALFRNDDYTRVEVPMLPVVAGDRVTRNHILGYSLALAAAAIAPAFSGIGGPVYLAGAVVLNALFVRGAWRIWRRDAIAAHADRFRAEKQFFGFSILYMTLHFALLLAEAGLRALHMTPAGWPTLF